MQSRKRKDMLMHYDITTTEGFCGLLHAYLDAHPAVRAACEAVTAESGSPQLLIHEDMLAGAFEYGLEQRWISRKEFFALMATQRKLQHEAMNRER
jgi:hypothetical protein